MKTRIARTAAALVLAAAPALASAQDPIKLVNVLELSGAIATAGYRVRRGRLIGRTAAR